MRSKHQACLAWLGGSIRQHSAEGPAKPCAGGGEPLQLRLIVQACGCSTVRDGGRLKARARVCRWHSSSGECHLIGVINRTSGTGLGQPSLARPPARPMSCSTSGSVFRICLQVGVAPPLVPQGFRYRHIIKVGHSGGCTCGLGCPNGGWHVGHSYVNTSVATACYHRFSTHEGHYVDCNAVLSAVMRWWPPVSEPSGPTSGPGDGRHHTAHEVVWASFNDRMANWHFSRSVKNEWRRIDC